MALFLALLIFLTVVALVFGFGYRHYVKPARVMDHLAATPAAITAPIVSPKAKPSFSAAMCLELLGKLIPVSPQDAASWKERLVAAGFRSSSALPVLLGAKIVLAAALLLLLLICRDYLFQQGFLRLFSPALGGMLGYLLPGIIVDRIAKKRREKIRLALADVLDLLVVCTEAGCGLDQAIINVSRELKDVHPELAEELSIVNMEIMAGKSRADALRNLGRRTGEEELKKLSAILIQTDRFGTSVSDALRTQADYLRIRRLQEAEERAGKVGVKLVFPIFFFCLPALLIVTAGEGMLQLFRNLLPMMGGAGH